MGPFPGEATLDIFRLIASNINWGHLIKERLSSYRSSFFSLRVCPNLGTLRPPGGQTGNHEICPPQVENMADKDVSLPLHIKTSTSPDYTIISCYTIISGDDLINRR